MPGNHLYFLRRCPSPIHTHTGADTGKAHAHKYRYTDARKMKKYFIFVWLRQLEKFFDFCRKCMQGVFAKAAKIVCKFKSCNGTIQKEKLQKAHLCFKHHDRIIRFVCEFFPRNGTEKIE